MYSLAKINESKKNLISNEYKNSMKIKQTNKSTEKLLKIKKNSFNLIDGDQDDYISSIANNLQQYQ